MENVQKSRIFYLVNLTYFVVTLEIHQLATVQQPLYMHNKPWAGCANLCFPSKAALSVFSFTCLDDTLV